MARRILYPTDGSPTAKAAGRVAADIAKGEGDSILVLAVAELPTCDGVEDQGVDDAILAYMKQVADEQVADLAAAGVSASACVISAEKVDEAIANAAREGDVDMIVMGTHGRTGLVRTVIGSVADKVMKHSEVPVVLVPLKRED